MKFTIIHNFLEAVDPEKRKLRLQKVAKYARRHAYLASRMWAMRPSVGKAHDDPEIQAKLKSAHSYHKKWVAPHDRRSHVGRAIVKKFKLPKRSVGRQELSTSLRSYRKGRY